MSHSNSFPLPRHPSAPLLPSYVSTYKTQSLLAVYVLTFSSLLITIGTEWDIMWHMSIGRDGLFAPPHIAMYIGATIAGLLSASQILQLTFQRNHPDRQRAVHFWGFFRGTTSALFGAWGSIAMLTSAPFDDWWHSAYGLDVKVLSPPHVLLVTGILMVQLSAMLSALTLQNQLRSERPDSAVSPPNARVLRYLFLLTAALLLSILYLLFYEKLMDRHAHRSQFYILGSLLFPVFLVATGLSAHQRYPMTTIAGLFMLLLLIPSWVLQFMPAAPQLAPVLNPIDHFQPFRFPMLLILPALGMDLVGHRLQNVNRQWVRAGVLGIVFLTILLAVQWPLSEFFLTSPLTRNRLLLAYTWAYNAPPNWPYRFAFHPNQVEAGWTLVRGLGIALLVAVASARAGLWVGNWMQKVIR